MPNRVYMEFMTYEQRRSGTPVRTLQDPDTISSVTVHKQIDDNLVQALTPVKISTGWYYGEISADLDQNTLYYHKWVFDLGYGNQTTIHYFMTAGTGVGGYVYARSIDVSKRRKQALLSRSTREIALVDKRISTLVDRTSRTVEISRRKRQVTISQ